MKVAYQTILWGPRLEKWVEVLEDIHGLGYQGVEIAQPPDLLPPPEELGGVLEDLKLDFVGLAGGLLEKRMDYCTKFRPRYLYVEDWDKKWCPEAIKRGFALALHPHMYKRVHRMDTAAALLEEHDRLQFLPDTGHLFVARENPAEAIRCYWRRLAGVHLKDWTPKYGRSFHRYARGFVELGNGVVDMHEILRALDEVAFDGWLVVEQDCTTTDANTSARESAEWLTAHGIPVERKPRRTVTAVAASRRASVSACPPESVARLMESLTMVRHGDLKSFCQKAVTAVAELVPSKVVKLWEYSPAKGLLGLLAMWPEHNRPVSPTLMHCDDVVSGITVEEQVVCHFDLNEDFRPRTFAHPQLIDQYGVTEMISVPVLNTHNPNHVELVINVFHEETMDRDICDRLLAKCAECIAIMYETTLEDVCQSAALEINLEVGRTERPEEFLDRARESIQNVLECVGVTIFLPNQDNRKLEARSTTGLYWIPYLSLAEKHYKPGEGLVGGVWKRRVPLLTIDAEDEEDYVGKSFEVLDASDEVLLIAPLTDARGKVVGVVRCRNKRPAGAPLGVNMFSESDASILDAIGQAVAPHLAVLTVNENRARTLGRLTHELKAPLTAIRGAVDFIEKEATAKDYVFTYPFAADICKWHDLARRLLNSVDFFRYHVERLQLKLERSFLNKHVLAPARNQIDLLLDERGFLRGNIRDDGFMGIPEVWIDRNQFQQVFFNLIINAIKTRPSEFKNREHSR